MTFRIHDVVRGGPMKRLLCTAVLLFATVAFAAELPLIEVPATQRASDTLVIVVSGDGGWANIDKSIARVLAAEGMPVVGLNSLQYFWTKRTPEAASRDLETIVDRYLTKWQKSRVVLVGYSRGADVLPAMTSRLAASTQARIRLIALLSPSPKADFEFHVMDWMKDSGRGLPVRPELERISSKTVCVWGEDDRDSLCNGLALPHVKVVTLKGAHHFDGGYESLARIILEALQ
jgi:type IV secretory pathway VirJ component